MLPYEMSIEIIELLSPKAMIIFYANCLPDADRHATNKKLKIYT
jgi:hypothetical protein